MIEIGGRPILWHIIKIYAANGINDFVVCLGYKGYFIKEYFANYFLHMSDVTFDMRVNGMEIHQNSAEPWRVTLVDTGDETMIGGRIKRILPYVQDDEAFCVTYGDGVGDVNIRAGIDLHKREGRLATITAVQPPGRFGSLRYEGTRVVAFEEKPLGDGGWINGGFFVASPKVLDYVSGDGCSWENEALPGIAAAGQLQAFRHNGFWQPMDTLRDKTQLEQRWAEGRAEWKTW